jgi:excinuclease ABC subunit A
MHGARGNNLKTRGREVSIPLGTLVCVSGVVSGSGKSTLMNDTLQPILVAETFLPLPAGPLGLRQHRGSWSSSTRWSNVDQSPSRDARRGPTLPPTRAYFQRHPQRSSWNCPRPRYAATSRGASRSTCRADAVDACGGSGYRTIEMNFLPDVYVPLRGVPRQTLQPRDAGGALQGQVHSRRARHDHQPGCGVFRERALHPAQDKGAAGCGTGLHQTGTVVHHALGRREPAREAGHGTLAKRDTGDTVYILDEPTTGLHFEDIRVLMNVIDRLVDKGNTVIVIEHNLDVLKMADYDHRHGTRRAAAEAAKSCWHAARRKRWQSCKKGYTSRYLKEELAPAKIVAAKASASPHHPHH